VAGPPLRPEAKILSFGAYEANLRTGELRKGGLRLKVQEKPFQVLTQLLEARGALVTREELRERLWPSDTFVDFDHGLNTAVNKLRDVLNDSAASPRYIETLPKRGYRFLAEVKDATPVAPAQPASPADPASPLSTTLPGLPVASARPNAGTTPTPEPPRPAAGDLPQAPRGLTRALLIAIQLGYLATYAFPLERLGTQRELEPQLGASTLNAVLAAIILIAAVGVPCRLYLLFSVGFDYHLLASNFRRLFPFLFVIDEIWALSGLLLVFRYGIALAFLGTVVLVYLPFSQRTLVWMAYGKGNSVER
jgi:DNA-binding winged helix-turn-helix (wHTH) protein